jgi:hypothetical protein
LKDLNENKELIQEDWSSGEEEEDIFGPMDSSERVFLDYLMGTSGEFPLKHPEVILYNIKTNRDAKFTEYEFNLAHKRFIDLVKFNFRGKELTLSALLYDEIFPIIIDCKSMGIVSYFDELIDCIEREIDKRSSGLKIEELHWQNLINIIKIRDYELRMDEFYRFLDQEKGEKENLIYFSENEELNRMFNSTFVYYCVFDLQELIQRLRSARDSLYFKSFRRSNISKKQNIDSDFQSLELFLKYIKLPIIFYKTEKDIILLFSKLISEQYLSTYVVGIDKKNGKHNLTKIQRGHFKEHFIKSEITENSINEREIELNENELETEFNKEFYKEKDDTLIEIERELEKTCFIWEGSELHLVHLINELTERKIIKGLKKNKKKKIIMKQKDTPLTNCEEKVIDVPFVDWNGVCRHFIIVKNDALEIIDPIQMGKDNLKESDKNKYNNNNTSHEINEYREIDQILDDIFGHLPYVRPNFDK